MVRAHSAVPKKIKDLIQTTQAPLICVRKMSAWMIASRTLAGMGLPNSTVCPRTGRCDPISAAPGLVRL